MARKEDSELFIRRHYIDGEEPCLFADDALPHEPVQATPVLDPFAVFSAAGEVPYEWDLSSDAIFWGPNVAQALRLRDTDAVSTGAAFAKLVDADNVATRASAVTQSAAIDTGAGVPFQVQYSIRPDVLSTQRTWIEDTGCWYGGTNGRPRHARGVIRIINERHEQEQQLTRRSRTDDLTGELNRQTLFESLTAVLDTCLRTKSSCGFLLVSIDNLARINEAYGYDIADAVILAIARRLNSQMRGGDVIGRYAGNQFGIVLNQCASDDIAIAADRLLTAVRQSVIDTDAGSVAVTITIGGVVAPRFARSVEEICMRAREALDMAKARRRGSFVQYIPDIERDARRRENVRVTEEIIAALNDRRMTLAFEPVVETQTRYPIFFECLMRLTKADGTLIPAQTIVPVAERLDLVRLLDQRVLELVFDELVQWPLLHASLNVSPTSTANPDWWTGFVSALRANADVAPRLTLEITETAAIHDLDVTRGFVSRAKDFGCRIAIDDFGAGYTSFRNLRKLGVDIVKIDGEFVKNLPRSEEDRAFVQTLIDLAHRLGLATVAEWVADEESAAILSDWGCDYLQGKLIGLASLNRPWVTQRPPIQDLAV